MAHRARLSRKSAANDRADNIELAVAARRDQRLAQDHAQHGTREIDLLFAAIDTDAARPGFIQTRATAFLRWPVA